MLKIPIASRATSICLIVLLLLTISAHPAYALDPDQILLLVNKNVPESQKLAEFYKTARNIPDGRICAINIPGGEEIPFDTYENAVVPAVRDFLHDNKLDTKIKCIVTFFGLPLRIAARNPSPDEKHELTQVHTDQADTLRQIRAEVSQLEDLAHKEAADFHPAPGDDLIKLAARWDAALHTVGQAHVADAQERIKLTNSAFDSADKMIGPGGILRRFSLPALPEEKRHDLETNHKQIEAGLEEAQRLQTKRADSMSRDRLRTLVRANQGLLNYAVLLEAQSSYLEPADTTASFENELTLLWAGYYPRARWLPNPLNIHVPPGHYPQTLMTARLDAPIPQKVRDMILAGLAAERDGLKGKIVLDSRGIAATGKDAAYGTYGWYDQTIRNLANILRDKTNLKVMHDDNPDVLRPNTARDVAIYCGWYSVRKYVPACTFNPGAVGFHIASYELVSLHSPDETGWCAGLINDGVVATLGPVAEPYLHSFPQADEFFPLLFTGKLTLAEVYWKTTPFTSWMQTLIGDPLYTPYKKNPAIKVEDLPAPLQAAFKTPATHPAD